MLANSAMPLTKIKWTNTIKQKSLFIHPNIPQRLTKMNQCLPDLLREDTVKVSSGAPLQPQVLPRIQVKLEISHKFCTYTLFLLHRHHSNAFLEQWSIIPIFFFFCGSSTLHIQKLALVQNLHSLVCVSSACYNDPFQEGITWRGFFPTFTLSIVILW